MRAAALAALSVVLLGGCSTTSSPTAAASLPASSGRTGPVITAPPVTPPTPPGDALPAFKCADTSAGTPGSANVTAVRVGAQTGYDRFVLQFDSQVPPFTVKRQAKTVFSQGGSGQPITLAGTVGALITVHTGSQPGTYTGSTDFVNNDFPILKEARLTQDFEGYVSWGVGLASLSCMRAFVLADPARLVVDFAPASS